MDDYVQDLLWVEYRPGQRILDGYEEFLLAHLVGSEAVCGIGLNDTV